MLRWFLALAVAAVAISSASAAFIVTAVPAVGPSPNGVGGTFFNAFANNAVAGLRAGSDAGSIGSASYYLPANGTQQGGGVINSIDATGNGVNGLQQGVVNAAGFNGHLGNFLYMGLSVTTTAGSVFQVQDVVFNGFNYAFGNLPGFNLSTVLAGGNVKGATTLGGPLTTVTAADIGSTNYAELYYVGQGYSIPAINGTDFNSPASLTALFFDPLTPIGAITGSYSVQGVQGSTGGVDINGAPAPATLVLMGLGFVGTGIIRRVRKS